MHFSSIAPKRIVLFSVAVSLFLFCSIAIQGCGNKSKSIDYIETVKTGYLGTYTEFTVEEILDGWMSVFYEDINWEEGLTDDDKIFVKASCAENGSGAAETNIEFVFENEDVFKICDVTDGIMGIEDEACFMNLIYYSGGVTEDDRYSEEYMKLIDSTNASLILYGASSEYKGNRKKLCEYFDEELVDMTVSEYMNSFEEGFVDDLEEETYNFDEESRLENISEIDSNNVDTGVNADNNMPFPVALLSAVEGTYTGNCGSEITILVDKNGQFKQNSGKPIGYLSVSGYGEGDIYVAEDYGVFDLGEGYYFCETDEETLIISIEDWGEGAVYVGIYHNDYNMNLVDDFITYGYIEEWSEKTSNGEDEKEGSLSEKEIIANQATYFGYKDVLRNYEMYEDCYVAQRFFLEGKVDGTTNQYWGRIYEWNNTFGDYEIDFNSRFVIIDDRYDKNMRILDNDSGMVYGRLVELTTTDYYVENRLTGKQEYIEIPIIEMYFFDLYSE